jgi:hypothetical protein
MKIVGSLSSLSNHTRLSDPGQIVLRLRPTCVRLTALSRTNKLSFKQMTEEGRRTSHQTHKGLISKLPMIARAAFKRVVHGINAKQAP